MCPNELHRMMSNTIRPVPKGAIRVAKALAACGQGHGPFRQATSCGASQELQVSEQTTHWH